MAVAFLLLSLSVVLFKKACAGFRKELSRGQFTLGPASGSCKWLSWEREPTSWLQLPPNLAPQPAAVSLQFCSQKGLQDLYLELPTVSWAMTMSFLG